MLDGFHQLLSGYRDNSTGTRSFHPIHDLERLRTLVQTQLFDISMCAQEVERFSKNEQHYCYNVLEMQHALSTDARTIDLLSNLRSGQEARCQQLQDEQNLVRTTLATSSDIT